ncbi:hypothetical protein [Streptomyces canus]|uniref:hypothetical protein n=1 Tax=Streptomyces canus TaxID=58343 RepID=UPI002E29D20E|nr:hypothetical protein [Streptomyces canus]
MPEPTTQRVPAITVYGGRAAAALQQVASLLDSASVSTEETQELLALIQAGAVESAQGDVIELAERPPENNTAPAVQGWVAAVQATATELAHVADRTITRAKPAGRLAAPTAPAIRSVPTAVDKVARSRWSRSWPWPSDSSPS